MSPSGKLLLKLKIKEKRGICEAAWASSLHQPKSFTENMISKNIGTWLNIAK